MAGGMDVPEHGPAGEKSECQISREPREMSGYHFGKIDGFVASSAFGGCHGCEAG